MFTCNKMMIFGAVLAVFLAYADAFFLNWGGSQEEQKQVYAYPVPSVYQQRYAQHQLQQQQLTQQLQNVNPNEQTGPLPAIPIQVPLQAQFSPMQNLHNVQLVPCLCPVTPNVEYDRVQEQH